MCYTGYMDDTQYTQLLEAIRQIYDVMATKDDIANMATKDDIQRLDTSIERLYKKVYDMEDRMATKDDIARLDNNIDQLRSILDKHAGILETDELERLALGKQVLRHDEWITRAAGVIDVRFQPQG